jgi:1-deoxy-D-xylulose-5-phosphate reductoisomerase
MKQRIALLGSTGSIGLQTLDIARARSDRFEIAVLTAGTNWQRLAEQAAEFLPDAVVIADEQWYAPLREALAHLPIKVYAGAEAIVQVVRGGSADVIVNALVGYAGMMPSLAAVETGKKLALANKESLVIAGRQIIDAAERNRAAILPIDSEHSAIFQSLVGEVSPARRLILTASGGPFLRTPKDRLCEVTVEQALRHPNWSMGAKITVDSSTLVNKGFEVIEAHWLFGLPAEKIDVLVHPQSVVHSMVEFEDGAIKAQLGTPDMRLPIQYALTFPERPDYGGARFDFARSSTLTFEEVDDDKFPALGIAYECLRRGGTAPCTMNAANEVAVAAFLQGRIGYNDIVRLIERALEKADFAPSPSVDDYIACDREVRAMVSAML